MAPLSVVGVWDEEFRKFADFDYTLSVLNGSGTKKAETLKSLGWYNLRGNNEPSPLVVDVVNYESAWRLEKEITAWAPDMIIADESHKIKTHSAAASKAMHRLGTVAKYKLALTGTPVTNKALDIFSQYKFLEPRVFGNSFYSFRNRYFEAYGYGNHQFRLKKLMEAELTRKIHSISYRATKGECLDLPQFTDVTISVDLEPTAAKLYSELVRDSYTELGTETVTAANVLTRLLRLSQLTGGFLGGDQRDAGPDTASRPIPVSTAKLDALADIIDSAQEGGQKLVVIARFIAELDAIKKLLDKRGICYTAIRGGTKERQEQVRRFQEDPDVTVFVGQISTAGLGITLTAANTLVFYSTNYSMSDYAQSKARIHRVGQTGHCTYYHIIARNTVDEKVMKALRDKADLAKTLIDDYRKGLNPYV